MSGKKYIFVVQVARQLCVDIINQFAKNGEKVVLLTGEISNTRIALDPSVEVKYYCRYNKSTTFSRLATWMWFTIRVFFYVLFSSSKNHLVFITTPPFTPFIGPVMKFVSGRKYSLVVWDLFPDALIGFGSVSKNSILFRLWGRMNSGLFKNAEVIITLGKQMAAAIIKYGQNKVHPFVIHNWADIAAIKPGEKSQNLFAIRYNQQNKLTVLYSGNMGGTHDFDSVLNAAAILNENEAIGFLLVGEGSRKREIENKAAELQLKNTRILPYQDAVVFPEVITTGDINVVTLEKGMEAVSVPSKTYSALAAGSVLLAIAPRNSELESIIETYKCGKLFVPGDVQGIVNFILSLQSDRRHLENLKENSRKAAADFTPENAALYYKYIHKTG